MDIINENSGINLADNSWKIYARNTAEHPHVTGADAKIINSLVTEGCEIDGTVINSVISSGVTIAEGAIVENSVIMPNAKIEAGAEIKYAIVGQGATVGKCAKVGEAQKPVTNGQWQIAVVGPYGKVADKAVVPIGAMVD
jgi:glucose-1-phosphate adenylyltransferase